MKRYASIFPLSFLILISFGFTTMSKAQAPFEFRFDSLRLTGALNQVRSRSDIPIFFKREWTDSLLVNGIYRGNSPDELLDSLLEPFDIHYIIYKRNIILTGDYIVVDKLLYDSVSQEIEPRYLFEREYSGEGGHAVMAVGKRSQMEVGGSAVVAGFVKNESTGDPVTSAVVYDQESETSTSTDERGFFSLKLSTGEHTLNFRYSGMKAKQQKIILFSDGNINTTLQEEPRILEEITIISDQSANVDNMRMGTTVLNMETLKNVPKVLGENDIIQAALTLPGVQNVGEGSSGINVRGGKTDQNLILLNNATIYNPFHFFGFFSSFNADILGNSELMKSGIPSSYGGRLSSLLNVKLKRANNEKFEARVGINPITTRASIEVPIIKGKTSMLIGGRTTYSDWILNSVPNKTIKNSNPSFSDVAANIDHLYGKGNSITLSAYYSTDQFKLSTDSLNQYTNWNASLEWTQFVHEKASLTGIAGLSSYEFGITHDANRESAFKYGFDIKEQFGKILLDYFPTEKHNIQFGGDIKVYHLSPGSLSPLDSSLVVPKTLPDERGLERALFLSGEFKITPALTIYGGLRYSFYSALGGRSINYYTPGVPRNENSLEETKSFAEGEEITTYHGPEIRFSGKYSLSSAASIKIGVTQMRQYIHSISNTISVSPTDTWKLSDPNFAPQQSLQYSAGYYREVMGGVYQISLESYYKTMSNLLDYKLGAELVLNENLETGVLQGEGRAYGLELLVKKPTGKLNGWLSYTYSRSQQKFSSEFAENTINNGRYFPSNFEKPHDVNLVANYRYTRRISYSLNALFSSGRPVTYPTAKYVLEGIEVTHFSDRNSFRIPNYFRIDVGVNVEGSHKLKKIAHSYWSFSIYNLLARKNVYSIFFANNNGKIQGYKLSVLGTAIPTITYNLKF